MSFSAMVHKAYPNGTESFGPKGALAVIYLVLATIIYVEGHPSKILGLVVQLKAQARS